MKVVILAGGLGTRLSEETTIKPKPMVEIGGNPILWHIMKIYSHYGFNDFIICLGYKGYLIKEWFSHYYLHHCDVTFDLGANSIQYHQSKGENWRVTLVDTGEETMTGGRIKRIKDYVGGETFMMTYGDGVADIDVPKLVKYHKDNQNIATMTSVIPEGRFGALDVEEDKIISFREKKDNKDRINGGFFVLEPEVFDYIEGDVTYFEQEPLSDLARDGKLFAFAHDGFWKCMDNLKDKKDLEDLWQSGSAPWKVWDFPEDGGVIKSIQDKDVQGNIGKKGLRW